MPQIGALDQKFERLAVQGGCDVVFRVNGQKNHFFSAGFCYPAGCCAEDWCLRPVYAQ
jgi:hypothetical protein